MAEIRIPAVLLDGEMTAVEQQDQQLLLCRVDGAYYAVSDICSHANVKLSLGKLEQNIVTCALHGARFDVITGQCITGPSKMDIASYDVSEDGAHVIIQIG